MNIFHDNLISNLQKLQRLPMAQINYMPNVSEVTSLLDKRTDNSGK